MPLTAVPALGRRESRMVNVNTTHFRIFYEETDRSFGEKITGRMEELPHIIRGRIWDRKDRK